MTGYNAIDISGIRIVNEKNRTRSYFYERSSRTKEKRNRSYGLIALLLTIAIAFGTSIFNSSPITEFRVTESGAPRAILEFVDRYPEASSFALDWEKYHNKSRGISISSEVQKGSYPLFIQWDKRWGYRNYGNGQFLGITGCGPTCLSMVYSGLTGKTDMDPYKMASYSEKHGYYVDGTGTSWNLMTTGASNLGLDSERLNNQKELLKALSNGQPVIVSVRAGDFTKAGHFILLTGLNEHGRITINDPNSPNNSKKSWDIDRLYPQIKAMWAFHSEK